MATPPFKYEPMFQLGPDTTEYYLLTKDYVSVSEFEGKPILKIEKDRNEYEINLSNGVEITFNQDFLVIDID